VQEQEEQMEEILKNIWMLFFSLDRKEPKDQDCKKMTRNIIKPMTEIELIPQLYNTNANAGFKQQFLFNTDFIHSFNVIFLRSCKKPKNSAQ